MYVHMSQDFARYFSGDVDVLPGMESWATPYALSIQGQDHNAIIIIIITNNIIIVNRSS